MNIYEFFNSKAIADHCQRIGHRFTALEMAYIIWISAFHTLEQKHTAWQYLIDHYPDEELPEGKWLDDNGEPVRKERSLHKFLQHYIEIEKQLLKDFSKTRDGYAYEYATVYSGEDRYKANDVLYSNYEACLAALREEMGTHIVGARITRFRLHVRYDEVGLDEISVHMNRDLDILCINSMEVEEDWAMIDGFSNMVLQIPTPFRYGDLVTCNRVDKKRQSRFVLLHIPYWEVDTQGRSMKWYADRLAAGEWTNMHTSIYQVDQDGDIYREIGPNYLFLEYCQDAPKDDERILLALSSYLQNKISLEDFLRAQRILIAEHQTTEHRRHFGEAEEIKKLAGLV